MKHSDAWPYSTPCWSNKPPDATQTEKFTTKSTKKVLKFKKIKKFQNLNFAAILTSESITAVSASISALFRRLLFRRKKKEKSRDRVAPVGGTLCPSAKDFKCASRFSFFLSVGKTAQRGSLCVVKEHQAHQLIIRLGYRSILNSLRRWNVLCSWEIKIKRGLSV